MQFCKVVKFFIYRILKLLFLKIVKFKYSNDFLSAVPVFNASDIDGMIRDGGLA